MKTLFAMHIIAPLRGAILNSLTAQKKEDIIIENKEEI
tara:strand:- start:2134 stop:2247 length:114 start_codon:yes stop_codon:yes gene_type:complete